MTNKITMNVNAKHSSYLKGVRVCLLFGQILVPRNTDSGGPKIRYSSVGVTGRDFVVQGQRKLSVKGFCGYTMGTPGKQVTATHQKLHT